MARKRKTPAYFNEETQPYNNIKIRPKTENQQDYLDSLKNNKITFVDGPAGSGKTYLATLYGLSGLLSGEYHKIIISRPVVEAGNPIGFLPGGLEEKLNPFLLPIYDILDYSLSPQDFQNLQSENKIEIVPFAFMRGRNFNNSYVILDEVQNCLSDQIILALTRFSFGSKMVLTGDSTQSDLPQCYQGGMMNIMEKLENLDDVGVIELYHSDIIREKIVRDILERINAEHDSNADAELGLQRF